MALPMAAAAAPAFPWGSVISGVGSVLGGLLGGKEKKGPSLVDQANASIYHQQMIDRNRPSWIVEGAKAAGIHPLTAMGISPASGMSFSLPGGGGGTDWGSIAAGMGQDIGNVIDRYRNPVEKTAARLESLTLERGELENQLLASQIAKIRSTMIPPQPLTNNVLRLPDEVTAGAPGSSGSLQAGADPGSQFINWNEYGDQVLVPGDVFSQSGMDDGPANWYYQLSRTLPMMVKGDLKAMGRSAWKGLKNAFSRDYSPYGY